jgi:hypothetical protein
MKTENHSQFKVQDKTESKSAEEILDEVAKENMVNVHNMLPTKEMVYIAMRKYHNQFREVGTKDNELMFRFIDWLYSAGYSKYWGSDEPSNGKWYKSYTMPDRKYYTLKELFDIAVNDQLKNK